MYGNTGRGFIQGRFRGKNFVYGEAEYRFGITRNRLLGGVVFSNAQSVTELNTETVKKKLRRHGRHLRESGARRGRPACVSTSIKWLAH